MRNKKNTFGVHFLTNFNILILLKFIVLLKKAFGVHFLTNLNVLILLKVIVLLQPIGLLKLMLNLFCTSSI